MNEKRTDDKIAEIRQYLRELDTIIPPSYGEYAASFEKKAACERYLEKIVEAMADLAFLYIKQEGMQVPEDDAQAFDIMANEGVIPRELAQRLKSAKGMRNVVAHQYGGINDGMVYRALKTELLRDARKFISACAAGQPL